jgi:hypothetical protein
MQWVPRFLGVEKAIASAQKSFCFRTEIHQALLTAPLDHSYEHLQHHFLESCYMGIKYAFGGTICNATWAARRTAFFTHFLTSEYGVPNLLTLSGTTWHGSRLEFKKEGFGGLGNHWLEYTLNVANNEVKGLQHEYQSRVATLRKMLLWNEQIMQKWRKWWDPWEFV